LPVQDYLTGGQNLLPLSKIRDKRLEFNAEGLEKFFPSEPVGQFSLIMVVIGDAIIKEGFIASAVAETDNGLDLFWTETYLGKGLLKLTQPVSLGLLGSSQPPDTCACFNLLFQPAGVQSDRPGKKWDVTALLVSADQGKPYA
jgi:hypothetical protein